MMYLVAWFAVCLAAGPLFERWLSRRPWAGSSPVEPASSCDCHPAFHDIGVHAPDNR